MRKILIFGKSGSGKSTLATELCISEELAHLDLDELAWLPTNPPERGPLDESFVKIQEFTAQHDAWVIEGCYTDLLELVSAAATEIIFLKFDINQCLSTLNYYIYFLFSICFVIILIILLRLKNINYRA